MDQSEIKLIHFDSAYYLPHPIPLTQVSIDAHNHANNALKSNPIGIDLLRVIFREQTNRYELKQVIKVAPATCFICNISLNDTSEVLTHIFSRPHMDICINMKGLISNSCFAFWMRLLKMFPKNRAHSSKELQLQELQLFSSSLDLHSRPTHWTVEVSSASEHETAMCEKVSAIRCSISAAFSQSQRVLIFLKDRNEGDVIANSLYAGKSNLPDAKFTGRTITSDRGKQFLMVINRQNQPKAADQSVIYLRPPAIVEESSDPLSAFCAIYLCAPLGKRSLMLISGSEEMAAFRAFEKKFMWSQETPLLPVYCLQALRKEMAAVEAEEKWKSTVDRLVTAPRAGKKKGEDPASKIMEQPEEVSVMPPWAENIPAINDNEVKTWDEIFAPFDEEEGKAVEELIERMMG